VIKKVFGMVIESVEFIFWKSGNTPAGHRRAPYPTGTEQKENPARGDASFAILPRQPSIEERVV
jgi:hypothetical protein